MLNSNQHEFMKKRSRLTNLLETNSLLFKINIISDYVNLAKLRTLEIVTDECSVEIAERLHILSRQNPLVFMFNLLYILACRDQRTRLWWHEAVKQWPIIDHHKLLTKHWPQKVCNC